MPPSREPSNPRPQQTLAYRAILPLLTQWREQRGLSRRQLAELLGSNHTTVNRIERGERRIDPVELIAWVRATGVEPIEAMAEIERATEGVPHRWEIGRSTAKGKRLKGLLRTKANRLEDA